MWILVCRASSVVALSFLIIICFYFNITTNGKKQSPILCAIPIPNTFFFKLFFSIFVNARICVFFTMHYEGNHIKKSPTNRPKSKGILYIQSHISSKEYRKKETEQFWYFPNSFWVVLNAPLILLLAL